MILKTRSKIMRFRKLASAVVACWLWIGISALAAQQPPALTSLSDPSVQFRVPEKPYVVLKRADVDDVLPNHRTHLAGIASLKHRQRPENLFKSEGGGLNFEHIHDGTVQEPPVLFEPRFAPLELRAIDDHTAELYQKPTPHWKLESCTRYHLLDDGTMEMTFECIPRERTFANGYIGLFWASYIQEPESREIQFKGHGVDEPAVPRWVHGITPSHGQFSTHIAPDDTRQFAHDAKFPLKLVFSRSQYYYDEPWYFGVSHGMAYVQMFRPKDQARLSQSPNGGNNPPKNPAWDFQFLIPNYEVGKRYQMVMRAAYIPYESPEQVEKATAANRAALTAER
jgi:hypothetical protein